MKFVGTISVRSILTMTFSIESVLNNDINRADNFCNKTITHLTTLKANYVASRVSRRVSSNQTTFNGSDLQAAAMHHRDMLE